MVDPAAFTGRLMVVNLAAYNGCWIKELRWEKNFYVLRWPRGVVQIRTQFKKKSEKLKGNKILDRLKNLLTPPF